MSELLIELNVNGKDYQVEVQPHWTLNRVIREKLGLTGTKLSCGTGECGACTVLVNGTPILSCLTLAARVDGTKIETIEGLSKGTELHPIQEAFVKNNAIQCGFCTPGMILTAKAFLDQNPDPVRILPSSQQSIGHVHQRCRH